MHTHAHTHARTHLHTSMHAPRTLTRSDALTHTSMGAPRTQAHTHTATPHTQEKEEIVVTPLSILLLLDIH